MWHGGAMPRGTVVPPANFCRLVLAARVGVEGVLSAAARAFSRGENPTFQAL